MKKRLLLLLTSLIVSVLACDRTYGVNWNNDKYLYKSKLRTLADGYPL